MSVVSKRVARVRNASREDLLAIDAINRECLQENYDKKTYDAWYSIAPDLFFIAEVKLTEEDIQLLDSEVKEKLGPEQKDLWMKVGYIFAQPDEKQGFKNIHVYSFAIRPAYRRQKLGKMLMETLHETLRKRGGVNTSHLHVRVDNAPAIQLYKKLGYKKENIRAKYYKDGTNAYTMVRHFIQDMTDADWQNLFAKLSKKTAI